MANDIKSLTDRFNKYLDKSSGPDGCWIWTGSASSKNYNNGGGYGQISIRENGKLKNIKTHRLSYEIEYGKIPENKFVLHSCDNTRCCNPKHLFIGNNQDNVNDMVNKNRNIKGETHPMHKISENDVIFIRASKEKTKYLSEKYGIAKCTIRRIRSKKLWRHI